MNSKARTAHAYLYLAHKSMADLLTWVDELDSSPYVTRLRSDLYEVAACINTLMSNDISVRIMDRAHYGSDPGANDPASYILSLVDRAPRFRVHDNLHEGPPKPAA